MLNRPRRIAAFINLGKFITDAQNQHIIQEWATAAHRRNNWFTPESTISALHAIAARFLSEGPLTAWAASYPEPVSSRKIGLVMAGNIPAVGFHDALCVLISGHILLAKPSTDDQVLILTLLEKLVELEPAFQEYIRFVERLNDADAYIATGSNNTARYFHYYFSKKPNIIRRNRTSVAVLTGDETDDALLALGQDALQYFGLGCRNVSKVFVPEGYDFTRFYENIEVLAGKYLNHHKYFNNYEYNKSVMLVNRTPHQDNGFLLITQSPALVSPISVLHFEHYTSMDKLKVTLADASEQIQCIAGSNATGIPGAVPFGSTQEPELTDYADAVDTMAFLAGL
ncbi:acyl-CoA reductase [Dyadobacter sandarakinus]|uniref:Acyl-CoA reductase n=1 Tax=Dyadobacter sandarakinus TaxID=2747268 RepID=A0ABX7I265_9BACT|nr:acyl-CoA reductase [Dyadobacter sandarakinus]QRQ99977.1 acyl-CoA reductase [Dyadobacter sandarakinus]